MRSIPGAPPSGTLRVSKSVPDGFVPSAGAGACPVLDTGTESIAVAMVEGAHVPAEGKKTSEGASSAACNGNIVKNVY